MDKRTYYDMDKRTYYDMDKRTYINYNAKPNRRVKKLPFFPTQLDGTEG